MIRRCIALGVAAASAATIGCTGGTGMNVSARRVVESAAPGEVFDAGVALLGREFGRLSINRETRTATSSAVEYRTASGTGTARGLVGAESNMRRIARFSVSERGEGAVARLRIDLERRDTAQRRVVQYQSSRLSDSPGQTPIERDAATTRSQNTVWTRVGRDRALERALLNELRDRFVAPPVETPNEQTPAAGAGG